MRREKGMTLIELLIAMGISVLIMAATFIIVSFSASTYDSTATMVRENNNTFDAVNVINRYIRTSYVCALSADNKSIFVTVDGETFGGSSGQKHTIMIAFDENDKTLYIDRLDGGAKAVISDKVSRIDWVITTNGVKYTAYETDAGGSERKLFSGYAYKRGR